MARRRILLTIDQAAHLCGVKPVTVRAWIARGKIIRHHPSGKIDGAELMHWMLEVRNTQMVDLHNRRSDRIA